MSTEKKQKKKVAMSVAKKRYFDPNIKGSLSSKKTFLKYNKDLDEATVDRMFVEENATKQFYPQRLAIKGEGMAMRSNYFGQHVMADTGYFEVSNFGTTQKYVVLGICELFSRCFFAKLIERPSGLEAVAALKEVINNEVKPFMVFKDKPISILTDLGTEFCNKNMKQWLQTEPFIEHHTLSSSVSKAAMVERKWRTLKTKIQIYLDSRKYGERVDFPALLQSICVTLNDTKTRVLGDVSPNEIRTSNWSSIDKMRRKTAKHLYWDNEERRQFYERVKRKLVARIGQYTRITAAKANQFQKAHNRKSSKLELFIVHKIKVPIPSFKTYYSRYQLRDLNDEIIKGYFKTSEIIPLPDNQSPFNKNYRYTVIDWERDKANRGFYSVQLAGENISLTF